MPTPEDRRASVHRALSERAELVMSTSQPTPTQEEIDLVVSKGIHPPDKTPDPPPEMPPLHEQYAALAAADAPPSHETSRHASHESSRQEPARHDPPARTGGRG